MCAVVPLSAMYPMSGIGDSVDGTDVRGWAWWQVTGECSCDGMDETGGGGGGSMEVVECWNLKRDVPVAAVARASLVALVVAVFATVVSVVHEVAAVLVVVARGWRRFAVVVAPLRAGGRLVA
eukprot:154195-Chlamydomonas_euryale.AAC.1